MSSTDADSENNHKNIILKKLFYNISRAGLHIPVQVIYDSPHHFIKELLQKSSTNYDNNLFTEHSTNQKDSLNPVLGNSENKLNLTWTRNDRNSRQRNAMDADAFKENLKQYYFSKMEEFASELVSEAETLKSINRTKNPFAFFTNKPDSFQKINETKKKIPVIFHFFSPTKNEQNNSNFEKVDHRYIIPILDKLKEFNDNRNSVTQSTNSYQNVDSQPQLQTQSFSQESYIPQFLRFSPVIKIIRTPSQLLSKKVVPLPYYDINIPVHYFYDTTDSQKYISNSYPFYGYSSYNNPFNNIYHLCSSPSVGYYPSTSRDPFQQLPINYFPNLVDYEPTASVTPDICQRNYEVSNYERLRKMIDRAENKKQNEQRVQNYFEMGKRGYDDDQTIEYDDINQFREKRNSNDNKTRRRYVSSNEIRRQENVNFEAKRTDPENTKRTTDVGPQISKLIVRRGGVAIAGAGGIATAGSGGTAIVGPGGTAFTTPASSGGVAMVGPGGKVIKVSDITDVLYGRTATNVAATGAGHATFTNKNGEVFTTSDNAGGVALVNPNGGFLGVSDDERFEDSQKRPSETKEVQLPPGARLLTTGPIIYYNPVYPIN